jgi:hypothetical protein
MADDTAPLDGATNNDGQGAAAPSQPNIPVADVQAGMDADSGGGASQPQGSAEPQSSVGLRDIARQHYGFDFATQFGSDDEFFSSLLNTARDYQSRQNDFAIAEQVRGNWDAYQEFLRSQQKAQQAAPQEKGWWDPPKYDVSLDNQMRTDANGTIRFTDGTIVPPEILNQRIAYHRYTAKWIDDLRHNPQKAMAPILESFKQELREEFRKSRQEEHRHQSASGILNQNAHWLYADPDRERLTPVGELYQRHIEVARDIGITDPVAKDRYAQSMMELEWARNQLRSSQAATAQPTDQGEVEKQRFLAASRKPRNGTSAGYANSPRREINSGNLGQILAEALKDVDKPW